MKFAHSVCIAVLICFLIIIIAGCTPNLSSVQPQVQSFINSSDYSLSFSTYLGGTDWEHARDVAVDSQGNVYVTGGTASSDFPTTAQALQQTSGASGTAVASAGHCDVFISKFDSSGQLVWSTYLGGPNYDRGYAIEVDDAGYVYVAGRAGPGFPVTSGGIQPEFKGVDAGIYGQQNGFIAKVTPDGRALEWATYVGLGSLVRDFDIDSQGNVYSELPYEHTNPANTATLPSSWFAGSFQSSRNGGDENGIIKISSDGSSVIWATWLGGSGNEQKEANIRVGSDNSVYIGLGTTSADMPVTPQAFNTQNSGDLDAYFARISADGRNLLFGTYFGSAGTEYGISTHNLAVDSSGNFYHSNISDGSSFPMANNGYQNSFAGGGIDVVVVKFNAQGQLIASTYLGGSGDDDTDGIYVDDTGNVYISGTTNSPDFPVTQNAYQSSAGGGNDAFFVRLSGDLRSLQYSSLIGGPGYDYGRSGALGSDRSWYLTGSSNASGYPVLNAYQSGFSGGNGQCDQGGCFAGDIILSKFSLK